MERKSLNQILKEKERQARMTEDKNGDVRLDDTQRVKVLSPSRLVFKRFIRNKLGFFTCFFYCSAFNQHS